jgi:hypothetical protein
VVDIEPVCGVALMLDGVGLGVGDVDLCAP